jgi:hypothetical protein
VIVALFLIGSVLLWLYFYTRLPPGIEAKGPGESLMPWISLGGAAVSLLTGVASLGLKLVEIRLKLAEVRAKSR